jgi:hypothetical protein
VRSLGLAVMSLGFGDSERLESFCERERETVKEEKERDPTRSFK